MDGYRTWILAFDASCGTCRYLAEVVARECGEKLDIRSLNDQDVLRWRQEALGAEPPWAPTLIKVDGEHAQAWVGAGMAIRLVRRLGSRSTLRLLRAFADLRERSNDPTGSGSGVARKDFLKLGAGTVAAFGLVVLGKTPAFADPARRADRAQVWVTKNLDRLPRDYDGFSALDIAYRRAVHEALTPGERSHLWTEHLKRRREALPAMSAERNAVFDRAMALAADERTFTTAGKHQRQSSFEDLRRDAVTAFGHDDAYALLATLGPQPTGAAAAFTCIDCTCSTQSSWCGGATGCCRNPDCYSMWKTCNCTDGGCGTFWAYDCNGLCVIAGPCPTGPC